MSGVFDQRRAGRDAPPPEQELEERRHSNASLSPTEHDSDFAPENESGGEKRREMELARTMSIAETLSLPREIIFVAIVCSAQLLTRKLRHSTCVYT